MRDGEGWTKMDRERGWSGNEGGERAEGSMTLRWRWEAELRTHWMHCETEDRERGREEEGAEDGLWKG